MFTPDVDTSRQFLYETWQKLSSGQEAFNGIERLIVTAIQRHPEYHGILSAPHTYSDLHYTDHLNPFLHLWLHVSLLEQLAINQPTGITPLYQRVCTHLSSTEQADALCIEALQDVLQHAKETHTAPDAAYYLHLIHQRSGLLMVE